MNASLDSKVNKPKTKKKWERKTISVGKSVSHEEINAAVTKFKIRRTTKARVSKPKLKTIYISPTA